MHRLYPLPRKKTNIEKLIEIFNTDKQELVFIGLKKLTTDTLEKLETTLRSMLKQTKDTAQQNKIQNVLTHITGIHHDRQNDEFEACMKSLKYHR